MEPINWNDFGAHGESKTASFEALCEHLFCREFGAPTGVRADFNQAGLETEPFKKKGFQSKYFDPKTDYAQIEKSITLALNKYKSNLNYIRIYLNTEAKPGESKKIVPRIEKMAKKYGIEIDWFTRNRFKVALAQPSNLDLAQMYFGVSDEVGFIRDNVDSKKRTLLLSKEYVSIPFYERDGQKVDDISSSALKTIDKMCMLSGNPASGKSTALHQLFSSLAGLDKATPEEMIKVIEGHQAVPQIINLKNCVSNTLEDILRNRQLDFKLPRGKKLGIIYLLDGLDELSEHRADLILSQIQELAEKDSTKKVIVSCRAGNLNRIKFFSYFKLASEYKIGLLDTGCVQTYFDAKGDPYKVKALKRILRINPTLISEINDVLSLVLLWEAVERLTENSTIIDLFDIKVHRILDTPELYKNLPALNLLAPKKESILALNEDISFNFHYGFQPLMPLRDLQELILGKFPRVSYNDANAIVDYMAGLFFDNPGPGARSPSFVYQHRRYQEFFFVRKLYRAYRANPKILRESGVLANSELFEGMFLKGLREIYEKQDDLVGCIDLNLIDVYLGNHQGFGVDDPYYLQSDEFMPALTSQGPENFNRLLEDDNLKLRQKIFIDPDTVRKRTEAWQKDGEDYWTNQYLKATWENGLAWLVKNVARFWKAGKYEFARELIDCIIQIQDIYKESKFLKSLKDFDRARDPYWEEYEGYLYYLIVIKEEDPIGIFKKDIQPQIKEPNDSDRIVSWREEGQDKALRSFLRVCIDNSPEKLVELSKELGDTGNSEMLLLLFTPERIATFVKLDILHPVIEKFVRQFSGELNDKNYHLLFYKRYFGIQLKKPERTFLENKRQEILQKRTFDWSMYDYLNKFAYVAYSLNTFTFEEELGPKGSQMLHHFNEQVVYSALLQEWISILRNNSTASAALRMFVKYCEVNYDEMYLGRSFKVDIAKMIARIIVDGTENVLAKRALLQRALSKERYFSSFYLHIEIYRLDESLFKKLVKNDELAPFEKALSSWEDDYPSKINRYFELSQMYSVTNKLKSIELFSKAIVDGTLRHGWRKDTIISYELVEAFEILADHNWLTREEVRKYTKSIFDMTMRLRTITDGKGTWRGPYNLVDAIVKHDLELAKKYKDRFIQEEGRRNASNSIITSILLREVELGMSVETIEKGMQEFTMDYDYEHKPQAEYYEEKFRVYLAMAQSDLYFDDERKTSFEKAHDLIEEMKREGVSYYLRDDDFRKEKHHYLALCKKYGKEPNVKVSDDPYADKRRFSDKEFQEEINGAKTRQKITGIYKKLDSIKIEDAESWRLLITRTYELLGHVEPFIKLMKKESFPHSDYYGTHSRFLYLGLAYALENPTVRPSIMSYLYRSTGHGGFTNVMKAYAQIDDETMCRKLFGRYFALCKLLVD